MPLYVIRTYVAMELCFIFITVYISLYKQHTPSLGIFYIDLIEVVDVGDYVQDHQDRPARVSGDPFSVFSTLAIATAFISFSRAPASKEKSH